MALFGVHGACASHKCLTLPILLDLRKTIFEQQSAKSAPHPGDPSSASALASSESRLHRRSTTHSAALIAVVQTSERAHSLPFLTVPLLPGLRDRDKTFPLPPGAPIAVRCTPQFRYPKKQFVGKPAGNRIL